MRLNDLDFHVEIEGSGPAVLSLHGFTGSVRAWALGAKLHSEPTQSGDVYEGFGIGHQ